MRRSRDATALAIVLAALAWSTTTASSAVSEQRGTPQLTVALSRTTVTDLQRMTVSGRSPNCGALLVDVTYFSYRGLVSGVEFSVETKSLNEDLYQFSFELAPTVRPQHRVSVTVMETCGPPDSNQNAFAYFEVVRAPANGHVTPRAVRRRHAFVLRATCFGSRTARWVPLVLVDARGVRHSFTAQTYRQREVRAIVDVPARTAVGPATVRFPNVHVCPGIERRPIAQLTVLPARPA